MKAMLWVLFGWVQQRAAVSLRFRKQERGQVLQMRRAGLNFGPISGWLLFLFVLMLLSGVAPSCERLPFFIGWEGEAMPLLENFPVELPQPSNTFGYSDFTDVRLPVLEAINRPRVRSAGLKMAESSRLGSSVMSPSASPLAHSKENGAIAHDSTSDMPRNISGVDARATRKLEEVEVTSDAPVVQMDEPAFELTITEPEEPKVPAPTSIADARELCGDQLDNDGDGLTDAADSDCPAASGRVPEHDREPAGDHELGGSGGR